VHVTARRLGGDAGDDDLAAAGIPGHRMRKDRADADDVVAHCAALLA